MKTKTKKTFLALAILLFFGLTLSTGIGVARPGIAVYTGHVSHNGNAIVGAKVVLEVDGLSAITKYTDSNGYYTITYFRPYNPTIEVSHIDYETEEVAVSMYGGQYNFDLEVKLTKFYGFVTIGIYGPVLPGAYVELKCYGMTIATTTTNYMGYYAIYYFHPSSPLTIVASLIDGSEPEYYPDPTPQDISPNGGYNVIIVITLYIEPDGPGGGDPYPSPN